MGLGGGDGLWFSHGKRLLGLWNPAPTQSAGRHPVATMEIAGEGSRCQNSRGGSGGQCPRAGQEGSLCPHQLKMLS